MTSLLFASLMYERTSSIKREVIKDIVLPGPTVIDQGGNC